MRSTTLKIALVIMHAPFLFPELFSTNKKILQQFLARCGQYRLRVELYALDKMLAVPQSHDFFIICPCGDLQARRQRCALYYQRMVSGRDKRVGQPAKQSFVVVMNQGSLAVHELLRPDDPAAEYLADALVPETNPEQGIFPANVFIIAFDIPALQASRGRGK